MRALPALLLLAGAAQAAEPRSVRLDDFSCTSGRYAVVLPQHYPTLHVIGRHQVTDLERRGSGAAAVTRRRIDYIGLRLELLRAEAQPNEYRVTQLDVISRRWAIGELSVGDRPWFWPWRRDPALADVVLDGALELAGPVDRVRLTLRDGRIVTTHYTCGSAAAAPQAARP